MTLSGLRVTMIDGVLVACLEDEIDLATAGVMVTEILRAIPSAAVGVVVDLSALRYLDSVGVKMIFDLARQLEVTRRGVAVALPADSPIRRLLEITRIEDIATVCCSAEECVERLRGSVEDHPR